MITLSLETIEIFSNKALLKEIHLSVHSPIDPQNFYFIHAYLV